MIETLIFLSGIYVGGGIVTSIVVQTVDEQPVTWKESAVLAFMWPYVLMTAGDEDE